MKKAIIILLGGFIFSVLFYKQGIGLNALFYAIFIILSFVICNKNVFLNKRVLLFATSFLAMGIALFMHRSALTGLMYIMNLFVLVGVVADYRTSIFMTWFNGLYNILLGSFHNIINNIKPEENDDEKLQFAQILKIVVVPLVLIGVFLILYRNANPIIEQAFDSNFDFTFILFSLIGAFFTANTAIPKAAIEPTTNDINAPLILLPTIEIDQKKVKNEMQIGEFSLAALNLLLIAVLVTEVIFLINLNEYGISALSKAVHSGVNSSIASIVLAIIVIVYCFRGDVNFIKNNQRIKQLAYVWIVLNVLLSISIFIKNFQYIAGHGLTHKRLGVMLYLLLCVIGLFTTYLKIDGKKNIRFLFIKNMRIAFLVLSIYSVFNWSGIITRYNLANDKIDFDKQSDQVLLLKNLPQNSLALDEYGITKYDFNEVFQLRFENNYGMETDNWQEMTYIGIQQNQ